MLFKFLFASAVSQSIGMRPEGGNSRSTTLARLGEVVASAAHTVADESMQSLQEASGIVNSILQSGNATDHMTDDDVDLLNSVIAMIDESIFGSMDSSHDADIAAIARAVAATALCNSDYAARIADGGDLYALQQSAIGYQNALNELQTDVDTKTQDNATKWNALSNHMSMISAAPACQEVPSDKTKAQFDVFFEGSQYVNWYTAQQGGYVPVRDTFEAADAALTSAIGSYAVGLAQRDVGYCDWKIELESGCEKFNGCFQSKSDAYLLTLKPTLEDDMQARIKAQSAGETIISNIKFLMGTATDPAPPPFDEARYVLEFTALPGQGSCKLEVLDEEIWAPTATCGSAGGPVDTALLPQSLQLSSVLCSGMEDKSNPATVVDVTGDSVKFASNRGPYRLFGLGSRFRGGKYIEGDVYKGKLQSFRANRPVTVVVAVDSRYSAGVAPADFAPVTDPIFFTHGSDKIAFAVLEKKFAAGEVSFQFRLEADPNPELKGSMSGIFVLDTEMSSEINAE